jgi:hypothetical protein
MRTSLTPIPAGRSSVDSQRLQATRATATTGSRFSRVTHWSLSSVARGGGSAVAMNMPWLDTSVVRSSRNASSPGLR